MIQDPGAYSVFHEILRRMAVQEAQLNRLEAGLLRLQGQLDVLTKQRNTVIEKIEYHFDQLKVEKLEGTLNIGLAPGGTDRIEDLAVNPTVNEEGDAGPHKEFPQIREQVYRYLREEVPIEIRDLEQRFGMPQDDERRRALSSDLARQIDPRIRVYLDQPPSESGQNKDRSAPVIQQLKSDIREALALYFENLKGKGNPAT